VHKARLFFGAMDEVVSDARLGAVVEQIDPSGCPRAFSMSAARSTAKP